MAGADATLVSGAESDTKKTHSDDATRLHYSTTLTAATAAAASTEATADAGMMTSEGILSSAALLPPCRDTSWGVSPQQQPLIPRPEQPRSARFRSSSSVVLHAVRSRSASPFASSVLCARRGRLLRRSTLGAGVMRGLSSLRGGGNNSGAEVEALSLCAAALHCGGDPTTASGESSEATKKSAAVSSSRLQWLAGVMGRLVPGPLMRNPFARQQQQQLDGSADACQEALAAAGVSAWEEGRERNCPVFSSVDTPPPGKAGSPTGSIGALSLDASLALTDSPAVTDPVPLPEVTRSTAHFAEAVSTGIPQERAWGAATLPPAEGRKSATRCFS
ncbi:hypothetical protein cyc_08958 [Cyclospora cayetanensis]|uniref:Uncharacterized protein n=1 Tax=Cyclospora cayetanensis TaxID=88456 RepID=A0A1D3CX42_9EIME|nr:hypothetical protein cyc_08958 [Cyclospora cayetanensis]